jgi:dihydroneopterin aldolase
MQQTQIELKGLEFFAYHGVLDAEAELGQRFSLDVSLSLKEGMCFEGDSVENTVNYVAVYEKVAQVFTKSRFNLIERAAEAIATAVLEDFASVQKVQVKVRKPSVPVPCVCDYFSAEVIRCR